MHADKTGADDGKRKLRGFLTAWLVFMIVANGLIVISAPVTMIVANALTASVAPLVPEKIQQEIPNYPIRLVWPVTLFALNVVFAIALLNLKKWGFYGLVLLP